MTESPGANEKNDYVRQKQAQLDELSSHIQELEERLRKEDTDAWIKAVSHFEGLKNQHAAVQQRIQDAQAAPHHTWQNAKREIERAWTELEKAIEAARAHQKTSK